jgi:hypothetical protein
LRALLVLLAGGVAGALLVYALLGDGIAGGRAPTAPAPLPEVVASAAPTDGRVAELEAEIARLQALLAQAQPAKEEAWPDDSLDRVELVLQAAYADANVDLLLEAIRRLLRMGEPGYRRLREMIFDFLKLRFVPTASSFRAHHLYVLGRIALEEERRIIGFIDFLLTDPATPPFLKPYAQVAAAYYIGSNAPGAEKLQETLMNMVLQEKGLPSAMMGGAGVPKRMQIFAMAMSGDPRMIQPLRDELNATQDKALQSEILGALAYLGDPETVPLIARRLDPRAGEFRQEIESLARLGTEEAHSVATEFLRAIPDGKRFYSHARRYVVAGGGAYGVALIRERVKANPDDPEIANTIGALARYPTKDSRDTLVLIRDSTRNAEVKKRADAAAQEIDRRLRGELPSLEGRARPPG